MRNLNENTLTEQPVIEWLKSLGYDYEFGPDLAPGGALQERDSFQQVLLLPRLKRSLRRLNPELSEQVIDDAINQIERPENPDLEMANKEMYKLLVEGVIVKGRDESGRERGHRVRVFDFENPRDNEFLVVNQFAIQGPENVCRPDVVVFVNGIPIGMFELKNPATESATIRSAFEQLQKYKQEIPDVFKHNQVLVVSDLGEAKHGTVGTPWEWFAPWKGIESEDEKHDPSVSQLELLVNGLFHKDRLMDIIRNFIVFEADSEKDATKYTKKMCLYHQYFGVNRTVQETLRAAQPDSDKKIGVFWHTQGSGKSLSMVFYANKIKHITELHSPTFVFLTDRNDLDGQLHKTFLRAGYPLAKQIESIKDLKKKLSEAGAEQIFTTIQKFDTQQELLTDRHNVIVVADEAHRSEYGKFAGNVRDALPNASFLGITGTPVSLSDRDTRMVFGDYVSRYQINRSVEDGATVPIYYEGRLVPLHLTNEFIDDDYDSLTVNKQFEEREVLKRKWARLEQAVGVQERLEQVAKDIVEHFTNRGLEGKGMVVTMSRRIAVEMYKLIIAQPNAPEAAVIISKPEDFAGQMQKETDNKELERRFKNNEDPLKLVIVCDMWLTGFDVPALHTMYMDKPLKGHTLMQAIARVNRIFRDKNGGLIVDYIGVADNLKKALAIYSSDIRKQAMLPIQEVIDKMMEKYDIVKAYFSGIEYGNWRKLSGAAPAKLLQEAVNAVITGSDGRIDDERKNRFLHESQQLFKLHALVMPHREANRIRNDVAFFQVVKKTVVKRTIIDTDPDTEIESAIRELIAASIGAEGVVDIFKMKEKDKPDISILDEKFLEEVKNMRFKNLAIEVLRKLLRDDIKMRMRKNLVRYKSLLDILEELIEQYENNIISSTKVIERLIELAREIQKASSEGYDLGLNEEETAFYDAMTVGKKVLHDDGQLKGLVKELVNAIKRDLTVDWSNNDVIRSRIRANVRLLLLRNRIPAEESESLLERIFEQARALYRDFVPAYNTGCGVSYRLVQ